MRKLWLAFLLLQAICLLQIAGCASTPSVQLYTLHSMAPAADAVTAPVAMPGGLGIGPIELPESWRQREVIVWGAGTRVVADAHHLWAGDPKLMLSRILTVNLSQQLQLNDIWAHPWDSRARPQQQILLVFESLGGQLGGEVEMQVKWRLTADFGAKVLATERQRFAVTAADKSYAAYVVAINQLIEELAGVLERSVRESFQ